MYKWILLISMLIHLSTSYSKGPSVEAGYSKGLALGYIENLVKIDEVVASSIPDEGIGLRAVMMERQIHPLIVPMTSSSPLNSLTTELLANNIGVQRTVDKPVFLKLDEMMTVTVRVSNTGESMLNNILVKDVLATGDGWADGIYHIAAIAAGQTAVISYSINVTDQHILDKEIRSKLEISDPMNAENSIADILNIPYYNVTVETLTDKAQYILGDKEVTWTLRVKNNGKNPIKDLLLDDYYGNGPGWFKQHYTIASLAPEEVLALTFNSIIRTRDYSRAYVSNQTVVTDPMYPDEMFVFHKSVPYERLRIYLEADQLKFTEDGKALTYTIKVENKSDEAIENLILEDSKGNGLGWVDGKYPIPVIAAKETLEISYSYAPTVEEWLAEEVINTARITDPLSPIVPKEVSLVIPYGALSISLSESFRREYKSVGEQISFSFYLYNHTNTILRGLILEDERGVDFGWGGTQYSVNPIREYSRDVVSIRYVITQEDIDNRKIVFKTTLKDPRKPELEVNVENSYYYYNWNAKIKADKPIFYRVGEDMTYSLKVFNQGGGSLDDLYMLNDYAHSEEWYAGVYHMNTLKAGEVFEIGYTICNH